MATGYCMGLSDQASQTAPDNDGDGIPNDYDFYPDDSDEYQWRPFVKIKDGEGEVIAYGLETDKGDKFTVGSNNWPEDYQVHILIGQDWQSAASYQTWSSSGSANQGVTEGFSWGGSSGGSTTGGTGSTGGVDVWGLGLGFGIAEWRSARQRRIPDDRAAAGRRRYGWSVTGEDCRKHSVRHQQSGSAFAGAAQSDRKPGRNYEQPAIAVDRAKNHCKQYTSNCKQPRCSKSRRYRTSRIIQRQ